MRENEKPRMTENQVGTRIDIYACRSDSANFLNTYGCKDCGSLIGPVETVIVPKAVIDQNKEIDYLNRVGKNSPISEKPNCKRI